MILLEPFYSHSRQRRCCQEETQISEPLGGACRRVPVYCPLADRLPGFDSVSHVPVPILFVYQLYAAGADEVGGRGQLHPHFYG
ncbi:hypothetical protein D3C87_1942020 [compost metagenome]